MSTPHYIKRFPGLADSANPYESEGGSFIADNVVCRRKNVLEPRRGYDGYAWNTPVNAIGWKEGKLVALTWDDVARGIIGVLNYIDLTLDPSLQVAVPLPMNPGGLPFDRPGGIAGSRTRFISANKATYFQSRYGLTKIESIAAGVSRVALQPVNFVVCNQSGASGSGMDGTGGAGSSATLSGPGTWLANNKCVAYRFTVCRLGANRELIESEPSDRIVVTNTSGGGKQVALTLANSFLMAPDAFFRIYRTKQATSGSDPGDEMFLIKELLPLGSADANGYLAVDAATTYNDVTADTSISSVALYTNPYSGGGSEAGKAPAPLAADMAYFKNRLLMLNTADVQRVSIKIIGTGTGGIVDGDTISINGTLLTFTTSLFLKTQPRYVFLATGGTVTQNIEDTAHSLVEKINLIFRDGYLASLGVGTSSGWPAVQLSRLCMARYVSISSSDPGDILIQSIIPGADTFTITTSSASGWDADYTLGEVSDPNDQDAGFAWSEQDEPEAVPLANFAIVGDASSAGQRVIALKEAALIFKQNNNNSNDGLWRWTDDGVTTALQLADPTVRLIAPETAQPLGNYVFALCDQGVMLFTENGQSVNVSHDAVERELLKLMAYVGRDTLAKVAFAVPNELEGEYVLCLPEAPNATSCTVQYVYNTRTEVWTRWTLPGVICGAVHPDTGQLVWGMGPIAMPVGGPANLWIEKRHFNPLDYSDPPFGITSPVNTATATMTFAGDLRQGDRSPPVSPESGTHLFSVGDLVQQAQGTYYLRQRIKAISYNSASNQTTITLDAAPAHPWSTGQQLIVLKAIRSVLHFLPFHANAPLTAKEWTDCLLLFRYCDLDFLDVEWSSELALPETSQERIGGTVPASPAPLDPFGSAFGVAAFDRPAKNQIVKCTIPQTFGMCALLSMKLTLGNAKCRWELAGIRFGIDQGVPDVVVR